MSQLDIKIRKLQDNGSTFRANIETLYLGGVRSAKVDELRFELPEEWKNCTVTLHVQRLSGTKPDPQILDENNSALVDRRWTLEKEGTWMLLAINDSGYIAMTKPGKYTCYDTIDTDTTTENITPSIYEQFVAEVTKYAKQALESMNAAKTSEEAAAKSAKEAANSAASMEESVRVSGENAKKAANSAAAAKKSEEAAAKSAEASENSAKKSAESESASKANHLDSFHAISSVSFLLTFPTTLCSAHIDVYKVVVVIPPDSAPVGEQGFDVCGQRINRYTSDPDVCGLSVEVLAVMGRFFLLCIVCRSTERRVDVHRFSKVGADFLQNLHQLGVDEDRIRAILASELAHLKIRGQLFRAVLCQRIGVNRHRSHLLSGAGLRRRLLYSTRQ